MEMKDLRETAKEAITSGADEDEAFDQAQDAALAALAGVGEIGDDAADKARDAAQWAAYADRLAE